MPSVRPRSEIPPAPPLIDQLGRLGTARSAYWHSTEDRDLALRIISQAAVEADANKTSFTREYVSDYLGRQSFGSDFCEAVRTWLDEIQGEVDGFGEILAAIEWVCQRINDLTGISIGEIRRTIERKAASEPMDIGYGREPLNHIPAELRNLDRDGAGAEIWRFVWFKCDVLRSAWEMNNPKPAEPRESPSGDSTPDKMAGPEKATDAEAEFEFVEAGGGYWIRGFGESGFMKRIKGLAVLQRLIQTPGFGVRMTELLGEAPRLSGDGRTVQEVMDPEALSDARVKRGELVADIDRAKSEGNTVARDVAERELKALDDVVAKSLKKNGTSRDMNNPLNRMRPRVHGQLQRAFKAMREASPPLDRTADHLEASISCEAETYVYRPGSVELPWVTKK